MITEIDYALFRASTTILLGNGGKANFWKDNWPSPTSLKELALGLYPIAARKNRTVREAMYEGKWIDDPRRKINVHLLEDFVEVFNMLWQITLLGCA